MLKFEKKNIPNLLTLVRLYLTPFILFTVLLGDGDQRYRLAAFILFFLASLTDMIDGYIARKFNLSSPFGVCFDPIADKVLVLSLLCALLWLHKIDIIPCLIVVIREVVISGIREFLSTKKIALPVSNAAKWKSFLQFIAIGTIIFSSKDGNLNLVGNFAMWLAAFLTLITMVVYLRQVKNNFND